MRYRGIASLLAGLGLMAVVGCGGSELLAYIGGGLPPGDGDIGGVVVTAVGLSAMASPPVVSVAGTAPVSGAEVILYLGNREVGRAITGAEGYFSFRRPGSGHYRVLVRPPVGMRLREGERQFRHRAGRQTFLTIVLTPAP